MAVIKRKFEIGASVRFKPTAFRSMTVRDWARDILIIKKLSGGNVTLLNARTGETAMVDCCDIETVRGERSTTPQTSGEACHSNSSISRSGQQ